MGFVKILLWRLKWKGGQVLMEKPTRTIIENMVSLHCTGEGQADPTFTHNVITGNFDIGHEWLAFWRRWGGLTEGPTGIWGCEFETFDGGFWCREEAASRAVGSLIVAGVLAVWIPGGSSACKLTMLLIVCLQYVAKSFWFIRRVRVLLFTSPLFEVISPKL